MIQEQLKKDRFSGHLFVFRGKNASLLNIPFWDGTGLRLFTKRIDHGRFVWPRLTEPGGTVMLPPEQLAPLVEDIDWRAPERFWQPLLAAESGKECGVTARRRRAMLAASAARPHCTQ